MDCYMSRKGPYFVFEVDLWSKVRQYEKGMVLIKIKIQNVMFCIPEIQK